MALYNEKYLSDETVSLLASFQNMSGWEILLFFSLLPNVFLTWCSDSQRPCTSPLSVHLHRVQCSSVLQRSGVPSLSCLCTTHPILVWSFVEAEFLFSVEHLPTLTRDSDWHYRLPLPSRSWGEEKVKQMCGGNLQRNKTAETPNANGGWL